MAAAQLVSTTIVGATTIEELQFDLGALSLHVDTEGRGTTRPDLAGPGKPRQAYAW
jgi:hypothetical protein